MPTKAPEEYKCWNRQKEVIGQEGRKNNNQKEKKKGKAKKKKKERKKPKKEKKRQLREIFCDL